MRVVNAILVVLLLGAFTTGLTSNAAAAQSALDPYSYIKAPSREERDAELAKQNKKNRKAEQASASSTTSAPGTKRAAMNQQNGVAGPIDVVLDGVKESTAGLGRHIAEGTVGMVNGTKKLGSKLASGLTGGKHKSEKKEKVAALPKSDLTTPVKPATPVEKSKPVEKTAKKKDGTSAIDKVAGGFKSAGGAVKSGTATVAKGFKSAGGKIVDGTHAAGEKLASLPKAIHLGGGGKKSKVTTAAKPAESSSSTPPNLTAVAPATSTSNVSETPSVDPGASGLRPEKDLANSVTPITPITPLKTNGGGLGGAAKRLAAAPKAGLNVIGHSFGKLNPFHKGPKQPSPAATAAAPAATAAAPGSVPK